MLVSRFKDLTVAAMRQRLTLPNELILSILAQSSFADLLIWSTTDQGRFGALARYERERRINKVRNRIPGIGQVP